MLSYIYKDLFTSEKDARRQSLDAVGHNTVQLQLAIMVLAYMYYFLLCLRRPRVRSRFIRKLEWRLMKPLSWDSPESKSLADWVVGGGWMGWMIWLVVRKAGNGMYHA